MKGSNDNKHTLKSYKALTKVKEVLTNFSESGEGLTYRALCKHEEEGLSIATLDSYYEAYQANPHIMWIKAKKEIVRSFLQGCGGKKPIYKRLLGEEKEIAYNHPYLFSFLFILILAFIGVIPGLIAKIFSLQEQQTVRFLIIDLVTLVSFVIVGFYVLLAIRSVETYVIKVICFEHRTHFKSTEEFQKFYNRIREEYYPEKQFNNYFILIIIIIILFLVSIHFISNFIFGIGFDNSFYLYVGRIPGNQHVNLDGFLITPFSLLGRVWFELGWGLVLLCMFGLVPYVIQMLQSIGKLRFYKIQVNFLHPDGVAGFKAVSNLLIWIEFLGVILIVLIQFFFILLSLLGVYQMSTIALIPLLDINIMFLIASSFALFPFIAAILVFIYPLRELKTIVSSLKREIVLSISLKINEYRSKEKYEDIQTLILLYDHTRVIPELFDYSTQLKTFGLTSISLLVPLLTIVSRII